MIEQLLAPWSLVPNENGGGGGGGGSGGSGIPMPTVATTGFTNIFSDNFSAYPNVPLGSFPEATNGRWGGYSWNVATQSEPAALAHDTRYDQTNGNVGGTYSMLKTCSIIQGVLDIFLHNEMIGGTLVNWSAAPWPIIPGNQPYGTIKGFNYTANPNTGNKIRANAFYGEVEFMFRFGPAPGFKTAWLWWPDQGTNTTDAFGNPGGSGEIDGPENDLDGSDVHRGFMHWDGSNDQTVRTSTEIATTNQWHRWKTVWTPTSCEYWLDGSIIQSPITAHIPNNPMHWVFQSEVALIGHPAPVLGASGHLQIDWVVMRQLNGIYL